MSFKINNGVLEKYVPEHDEVDIVIPDDVVEIKYKLFRESDIESVTFSSGVRTIGEGAFEDCYFLKNVTFNKGLEKIMDYAFYESGVKQTELPETVKTIGKCAFASSAIERINIPEKVKHLEKNLFRNCKQLESISVSEKNKKYTSVDGVVFSNDMKTLILYPSAKKDSCYVIPDGVEVIQKNAFSFCANLTSITFPESIRWIEAHAFHICSKLKHITISDCEMIMNKEAFYISQIDDITITGKKTSMKISADFQTTFGCFRAEAMRLIRCATFSPRFKDRFFAEIKDAEYRVPVAIFLLIEYDYPVVKAYVSRNIRFIVKYLIDTGDAENLTKLLVSGYVTKKNVGDFINYAIKRKSPEMQLILTKYKHDNLEFDTEDSFDKFLL